MMTHGEYLMAVAEMEERRGLERAADTRARAVARLAQEASGEITDLASYEKAMPNGRQAALTENADGTWTFSITDFN